MTPHTVTKVDSRSWIVGPIVSCPEPMSSPSPLTRDTREGLSASPNEIDIELLAFIERYASSLIKWDLIVFFGENPYSRDTADNVARRIGRSLSITQRELNDLVILGLIERSHLNGEIVYQLAQENRLRRLTSRFVAHVSEHLR